MKTSTFVTLGFATLAIASPVYNNHSSGKKNPSVVDSKEKREYHQEMGMTYHNGSHSEPELTQEDLIEELMSSYSFSTANIPTLAPQKPSSVEQVPGLGPQSSWFEYANYTAATVTSAPAPSSAQHASTGEGKMHGDGAMDSYEKRDSRWESHALASPANMSGTPPMSTVAPLMSEVAPEAMSSKMATPTASNTESSGPSAAASSTSPEAIVSQIAADVIYLVLDIYSDLQDLAVVVGSDLSSIMGSDASTIFGDSSKRETAEVVARSASVADVEASLQTLVNDVLGHLMGLTNNTSVSLDAALLQASNQ